MGNLAGLRTFRVLRALKTIAILPSKSFIFDLTSTLFTVTKGESEVRINSVVQANLDLETFDFGLRKR